MYNFSFKFEEGIIFQGAAYCEDDFGFYYEKEENNNYCSIFMISLDPLEISISFEKNIILYVDGYCPAVFWKRGHIPNFSDINGAVRVYPEKPIDKYVAYRIQKDGWVYIVDISKKIFFSGNYDLLNESIFIKINKNQWIALKNNFLVGVLIQPLKEDFFFKSIP